MEEESPVVVAIIHIHYHHVCRVAKVIVVRDDNDDVIRTAITLQ